jgi:hypothetical protein
MPKKSELFEAINLAILNKKLDQPFSVADVNRVCNNLLANSSSFLSKHRLDNPGGYTVYFIRVNIGQYKIKL